MSIVVNMDANQNQNGMQNVADPDETALDLHCLHRYLVSSAGLKVNHGTKWITTINSTIFNSSLSDINHHKELAVGTY